MAGTLTKNPNAEVSIYTGAATTVILGVLDQFGITLDPTLQGAITTLLIGLVLFLGKRSKKDVSNQKGTPTVV